MAVMAGEERYSEIAVRSLRSQVTMLTRAPQGFGNWLKVLELYLAAPSEVVIVGDPAQDDTRRLLHTLYASYAPNRTVAGLRPGEPSPLESPLFEARGMLDGKATAYVCRGYACDLPTTDDATFARQLRNAQA